MVVHAAFGGCTNLLLHIPAIAHAAGLPPPDGRRLERASTASVPRLVDVLPNGPVGHPTVQVFLAGGVPEVMLHLRELGLLRLDALHRRRATRWARCSTGGSSSERRAQLARAARTSATASTPTT